MRMILIAVAVALVSFIAIYFISDMGYEVAIRKVEPVATPVQQKTAVPAKVASPVPVAAVKIQAPLPIVPTALPSPQPDPTADAERAQHLIELQAIQRDMTQLQGAGGQVDIDRLEQAVEKFSDLDVRAPELGIGKIINAKKLQELVSSLRGITELQKEITALTKDPDNIDPEKMKEKLMQLQNYQTDMMRVLPYIRPQVPASP
ncbi:MAG: hypothetical protein R8M38_08075 [Mariprofundaceae bacterium]